MRFRLISLCILAAEALDVINYGAFTMTATYSIANQLGFFTAYDLSVFYSQVPNSTFAYQQVLTGGYDVLTGTIDNSVNLRLNSNESVTVLGQLDQGPDLVVASVPSITSIAQLEGRPLIVDSPVSGYAYLLRKILSANGLSEGTDYIFQTVGGTNLRYADLVAGTLPNGTEVFGTMLLYPFTAEGEALVASRRPNILEAVSTVVNPISSSAFTTRESALSDCDQANLVTRFLSARHAANLYLLNPKNKKCATSAISKQLQVSAVVAELEYNAATDPDTGEVSPGGDFTVNQQGLQNVIAVREEFGGFSGLPPGFSFTSAIAPGKGQLIDYSIRDAAVAMLKKSLLGTKC